MDMPKVVNKVMVRPGQDLNDREKTVLMYWSNGFDNNEIADFMGLSPNTIRDYGLKMFVKLDANNRTKAVATALREGYIE